MRSKIYFILSFLLICFGLTGLALAQTNILPNGDLETYEPGFWSKVNDGLGGAQCTWADDEAAGTSIRSFKVEKSGATSDSVGWMSDNNANLYWNDAAGGVLYNFTFQAKTSGVNTSPANNDERIGVWYKFYAGGNLIAERHVPVDQSASSVDWAEYTDGMVVSQEPDEVYAVAVMGKNATGTVWFDNVNCGTSPDWSMGIFNADAETPVGWLQWADGGKIGFAGVVSDTVHSGDYGVLLCEKDTLDDEMVFYSIPYPATAGKWYKFGVWVKTDSINTDPLAYPTNWMEGELDQYRMGITFIWHTTAANNEWTETGGQKFFYIDQRNSSSDWTYYSVVAQAPAEAGGIAMRARFTQYPTGYAWFDDFSIEEVQAVIVSIENPGTAISTISNSYGLMQNYPNPFNPETIIDYQVPARGQVELVIYNMLGQKIRTLVNENKPAGTYNVLWNGKDDSGNRVATGIYIYQLRGTNALITKKMMLIK
jgi:membrane-bound inhibitor of C-type lysozyme